MRSNNNSAPNPTPVSSAIQRAAAASPAPVVAPRMSIGSLTVKELISQAQSLGQRNIELQEELITNQQILNHNLLNACNVPEGDYSAAIKALLENGASINCENQDGCSPLHTAIGLNNIAAFNALMEHISKLSDEEKQSAINAVDNQQWTPLHVAACYDKNGEMVKKLLEAEAEINCKNQAGATPLYTAIWHNNPAAFNALMEHISKLSDEEKQSAINAVDNQQWTPLHYAAQYDKSGEIVKKLLEAGADINCKHQAGSTPLYTAIWHKNIAAFNALIEHISKLSDEEKHSAINAVNNKQCTPLHVAAEHDKSGEMVKKLLEAGADINYKLLNGSSPLHVAIGLNNPTALNILIDHISKLSDEEKQSAITAADNKQWTPLHYAAQQDKSGEMVKKLLEAGADINCKHQAGSTPLYIATCHNNVAGFNALMDHISKLSDEEKQSAINAIGNQQRTPLHYAAAYGKTEMVELLIAYHANLNAQSQEENHEGYTALHYATAHNHVEVVKALIKAGADITILTNTGKSVFAVAVEKDLPEIAKALLQGGHKISHADLQPLSAKLEEGVAAWSDIKYAYYARKFVELAKAKAGTRSIDLENGSKLSFLRGQIRKDDNTEVTVKDFFNNSYVKSVFKQAVESGDLTSFKLSEFLNKAVPETYSRGLGDSLKEMKNFALAAKPAGAAEAAPVVPPLNHSNSSGDRVSKENKGEFEEEGLDSGSISLGNKKQAAQAASSNGSGEVNNPLAALSSVYAQRDTKRSADDDSSTEEMTDSHQDKKPLVNAGAINNKAAVVNPVSGSAVVPVRMVITIDDDEDVPAPAVSARRVLIIDDEEDMSNTVQAGDMSAGDSIFTIQPVDNMEY
jgi:ankyrin repeat protein